jgi:hypothetical protein
MSPSRVAGGIYGLLEAYRYVVRAPGSGHLVLISVLETLLNTHTLAPACLPETPFGAVTYAALSPVFVPRADMGVVAQENATHDLLQVIHKTCGYVLEMPVENTKPATFLVRYLDERLGHICVEPEPACLVFDDNWSPYSSIVRDRVWMNAFHALVHLLDDTRCATLDMALGLYADAFADQTHPVAHMALGCGAAIIGALGGAALGHKRMGPLVRRHHDSTPRLAFDPSGGDRYQRHGFFGLLKSLN